MITYGHHVFGTLTVRRDSDLCLAWQSLSTRFNRFIQKYRRLHHGGIQYVRCVEAHADGYPHIHVILQFHASLAITDARYFDRVLYSKWKELWTSGLSDYQPPYSGTKYPILYIIKYLNKNNVTTKTLWKKMYRTAGSDTKGGEVTAKSLSARVPIANSSSTQDFLNPKFTDTVEFCQQFKIKQLTWSRGFKFPTIVTFVPK